MIEPLAVAFGVSFVATFVACVVLAIRALDR